MMRLAVGMTVLLLAPGCARAADPDFVRMWEEAQKGKPAAVATAARIAPQDEPGEALRIRGTAYFDDGTTPAAGVIVFAYQTDARGVYGEPGFATWRLRGWARADEKGRFTFLTIRPGGYPGGTAPEHVHFTLEGESIGRRWGGDLEFADDPRVTKDAKARSARAGRFGSIRPVTRGADGIATVEVHLRAGNPF